MNKHNSKTETAVIPLETRIKLRLTKLEDERARIVTTLAQYDAAIGELKEILNPKKETVLPEEPPAKTRPDVKETRIPVDHTGVPRLPD